MMAFGKELRRMWKYLGIFHGISSLKYAGELENRKGLKIAGLV